jgi:tRNA 2-thiouridine synthesizing protein E
LTVIPRRDILDGCARLFQKVFIPEFRRRLFNMPNLAVDGREIELDEEGFLVDFEDWTNNAAAILASEQGIKELTEEHWQVIKYLREYYKEFKIAPMIRKLCKDTGLSLKQIYELFPSGPARGACKIAGLPKPTGCV